MHGASATGQTVFLEPLETVESNNQLVQLAEEEAAEIISILRSLTERLGVMHAPLVAAAMFNLPGSKTPDSPLMDRARAAVKTVLG